VVFHIRRSGRKTRYSETGKAVLKPIPGANSALRSIRSDLIRGNIGSYSDPMNTDYEPLLLKTRAVTTGKPRKFRTQVT
jgi:hypothetical protein